MILAFSNGDINLAFSNNINENSKILTNRNVIERAKKIMPYLTYDNSPYLVITNEGNLVWVIDAYTTSKYYPYSQKSNINGQEINYIKNSVKVLVDAYNGKVEFYITDRTDPIAMAYNKAFPDVFMDIDKEIPSEISEHFTYSEFLYNIQAEILKRYHNTEPDVLYRANDVWDIAKYGAGTNSSTQQTTQMIPYYAIVKTTDSEQTKLGLVLPYTIQGKQSIAGYTVGTYENDIYEKNHVVLEINKQRTIGLPASGFICLDYRKDKINVERQLDALNVLEKEDYQCSFNLKRIISGVEPPSVNVISKPIHMFNEKLDFPQRTAIKKALDADSIAIIQGPPGTGKTNVIIEIILQILKANKKNPDVEPKKVLLVSQSHPAVDKMLEDLIRESDERPDLLRIGRDEKLNEEIREEYSINDVKEKWYQNVRRICNDYTKNALEEIGIPEEEFDKYFLKLENSKVENMDFSVEDKLFVENFIKKTKGVKSERTRKILEIQREWTEQLKKCDEVELYIIKSTVIIAGTCTGFVSNMLNLTMLL